MASVKDIHLDVRWPQLSTHWQHDDSHTSLVNQPGTGALKTAQ